MKNNNNNNKNNNINNRTIKKLIKPQKLIKQYKQVKYRCVSKPRHLNQ